MDIRTFSINLERLCETLETANLQASVLLDVSNNDDVLYEVREKLESLRVRVRDAALYAYDVNNDLIYMRARQEQA